MSWYVYILLCSDGSYYTGRTNDLTRRISEHEWGIGSQYTMKRRPIKLEYSYRFSNESDAYRAERQIKGWRREKKEALINGDFELLIELSKGKSQK